MKLTIAALLGISLVASSVFAGPLPSPQDDTTSLPFKLLRIETGLSPISRNTTHLERRTGVERVACYNEGTGLERAPIIHTIDDWCNTSAIGTWVPAGYYLWARYHYDAYTVYVHGEARTSCGGFRIDNNCNRLLRIPVDQCNTGGENDKQGGWEYDDCGIWVTDPGVNGSDW